MSKEKENSSPEAKSDKKEEQERKLLEEHPYETMSQVQNRYGEGREQNGSAGSDRESERFHS